MEYDPPNFGSKAALAAVAEEKNAIAVPFKSKVPRFEKWEKVWTLFTIFCSFDSIVRCKIEYMKPM